VVTIALLMSWIAAVVFIPYLGYKLLPDPAGGRSRAEGAHRRGRMRSHAGARRIPRVGEALVSATSPPRTTTKPRMIRTRTPFYQRFRGWCVPAWHTARP
jgi:multidrug efflux pump subunit AcrB